jgi:hypothetical protein
MISYVAEDNEDTELMIEDFIHLKVNCWIPRLLSLPSHWFQNKRLTTVPKLHLWSPKILKQSNSVSYKP